MTRYLKMEVSVSDVWKLPESRKYCHADIYESSIVWCQKQANKTISIWNSWWRDPNVTWSLDFWKLCPGDPNSQRLQSIALPLGQLKCIQKNGYTTAHCSSPKQSCELPYQLPGGSGVQKATLKWKGRLPWVGQAKCSSCRQRLCKTCPCNLGVSWSTFQIIFLLLERVIQI